MQIRVGIQYLKELQIKNAEEVGFSNFEVSYEECDSVQLKHIQGFILKVNGLTKGTFLDALKKAKEHEAEYIVLDTQDVADSRELYKIVEATTEEINGTEIVICIENGYKRKKNGDYCCSVFSEAGELRRMVESFNSLCGKACFGVCLNVGYAKLVEKNEKSFATELGECIKVLHASDNDGKTNQHQMPCTFTVGRGTPTTNWYRIIGALLKNRFDGWIVFDVTGFIKRTPEKLQKAMLRLVWEMGQEWEKQFRLEEVLNCSDKKIILFGAGKMAQNYMESLGEKYPPAFLVDNNSQAWGLKALGFEIKSPNAILEVPEQERSVWICNQYYDAVGKQLRDMGVTYQCFWDQYYL